MNKYTEFKFWNNIAHPKFIYDGWQLTQIGEGFNLWCSLFHEKYHEYKKEYDQDFMKCKCNKCNVVYMEPIIKI